MNLVEADVVASGDAIAARVGDQELDVPDHVLAERPGLRAYDGRTVGLGIRPEHLHAARDGDPARLRGVARATEALGSELLVHVEVPAEPVLTEEIREVAGDVDAAALERLESEAEGRRTLLVARLLTQERPVLDTPIDIGVDTRRLHFFDLDAGLAIFG